MEESTASTSTLGEKNEALAAFFERMNYTDDQKAAFYLGRILGNVAYAQWKKGHRTKPVLGKINYNGMDAKALVRLRLDLLEKCRQYNILKFFIEDSFSKFHDHFKLDGWDKRMKPDEALFFLLAGYSFKTTDEDSTLQPDESEETEH